MESAGAIGVRDPRREEHRQAVRRPHRHVTRSAGVGHVDKLHRVAVTVAVADLCGRAVGADDMRMAVSCSPDTHRSHFPSGDQAGAKLNG